MIKRHLAGSPPAVRGIVIAALILGGAVALARGRTRVATAHAVPGGVLMGDAVAALPFDNGSFDSVVSTFSLHHWSDRTAGLNEIARVLAPGGRALIWDLKPRALPFHPPVGDAAETLSGSCLKVIRVTDWRWPGPLTPSQRIDCAAR